MVSTVVFNEVKGEGKTPLAFGWRNDMNLNRTLEKMSEQLVRTNV